MLRCSLLTSAFSRSSLDLRRYPSLAMDQPICSFLWAPCTGIELLHSPGGAAISKPTPAPLDAPPAFERSIARAGDFSLAAIQLFLNGLYRSSASDGEAFGVQSESVLYSLPAPALLSLPTSGAADTAFAANQLSPESIGFSPPATAR